MKSPLTLARRDHFENQAPRCRHHRSQEYCTSCQVLAFLCVNEYGGHLPHVDIDACRIIHQQLHQMYEDDWYDGLTRKSVRLMMNRYLGPDLWIHEPKPRVKVVAANPLAVLRAAENRQSLMDKQTRKARQQQNRRR